MSTLSPAIIWNNYQELFESEYEGDKTGFRQDNINLLNELKNKALFQKNRRLEEILKEVLEKLNMNIDEIFEKYRSM